MISIKETELQNKNESLDNSKIDIKSDYNTIIRNEHSLGELGGSDEPKNIYLIGEAVAPKIRVRTIGEVIDSINDRLSREYKECIDRYEDIAIPEESKKVIMKEIQEVINTPKIMNEINRIRKENRMGEMERVDEALKSNITSILESCCKNWTATKAKTEYNRIMLKLNNLDIEHTDSNGEKTIKKVGAIGSLGEIIATIVYYNLIWGNEEADEQIRLGK
jgi:hypothetical protein